MKSKKGFSLVELSIVLIIVALLIAGVISGKSLINNSKMNLINSEFNTLKVALRTYIDNNGLSDYSKIVFEDLISDGYLDEYNDYKSGNIYYTSKVAGAAWYYTVDDNGNISLILGKTSGTSIPQDTDTGVIDGKFCKQFGSKFSGVKTSENNIGSGGTTYSASGALLVKCGNMYYDKLTTTNSKVILKITIADIYQQ